MEAIVIDPALSMMGIGFILGVLTGKVASVIYNSYHHRPYDYTDCNSDEEEIFKNWWESR